jgi:coenzyme Q-binding protein COQ10
MITYNTTTQLPYEPHKLCALVSNVDDYHLFLPWCASSRVLTSCTPPHDCFSSKRHDDYTCVNSFQGELRIEYGLLRQTFLSDVTEYQSSDGNHYQINAFSDQPPFKLLNNVWTFQSVPNLQENTKTLSQGDPKILEKNSHCLVTFSITLALKNILLHALVDRNITRITQKIMKAFEEHAKTLYGQSR